MQILFVEKAQLFFYIHLAVEIESRVRGVIVLFVISDEVLICQLYDVVGMTSRYGGILARFITL